MREILFRGKRIDSGEWVYGNYIEKIKPTKKDPTFWCCFIQDRALSMLEVDPKTAGQFTGLTDKNGKKIFEGDIVRHDKMTHNSVIVWMDSEYKYKMQPMKSYNQDATFGFELTNRRSYNIIKMGDIHDNPELLK